MTDIPDLASLTIKDLRQLAAEHNIQNRSRLGKDDLIAQLTELLHSQGTPPLQHQASAAASAAASSARAMAHGARSGSAGEDADPAEVAAHEALSESAETVAVTPSLTMADVGHGGGAHAHGDGMHDDEDADDAADARADAADDDDDEASADAEESGEDDEDDSDEEAEEELPVDEALRPSLAAASAAEPEEITAESVAILTRPPARGDAGPGRDPRDQDAAPGEGDPSRRRRRRRRRRGRGRDGDAGPGGPEQGGAGGGQAGDRSGGQRQHGQGEFREDDAAEGGAEGDADPESDADLEADLPGHGGREAFAREERQAAPRAPAPARGDSRGDSRGEQRGDSRGDQRGDRRGQGPDQRPQPVQRPPAPVQHQPPRPPRPRLEGPLRSVPSVLDRLCTFSRGILELCSPDTPGWAQPRLSELLAESGMVMVPVIGLPHPDFHEVIGTVSEGQVPPGHIAQMVTPGFALRGDRGDLFPLRRARVRVADGGGPASPGPGPETRIEEPLTPPDDGPDDRLDRSDQEGDADPADPVDLRVDEDLRSEPAEPEPLAPGAPAEHGEPGEDEREDGPHEGRARSGPREPQARTNGADPAHRAAVPPRAHAAPAAPRHEPARREAHDQRPPPANGRPQPPSANGRPQSPPPANGRPPLRTHAREDADAAPRLPLTSQHPDELAGRPKSEGFRSLGLNDQILADLAAIGYSAPTPIQQEAIPAVLAGKDLIGQAQTGTGKTAAFVLPLLQSLYATDRDGPVALVLLPTRELARQVHAEFVRMAGASGARAALIYGGVPMDDQVRALERRPHVVIGTPGRIIDHMRRRTLDLSRLLVAVLDEADQMLDIGFWPDVMFIISHSPPSRQMLLFSATFPEPIRVLAEKHMKEPVHVRITPAKVTVEQVDQKYIAVSRERKNELLAHFIETEKPEQLVVFCRTKHQTDRVAEVLKRKHMSAAAIHGDLPQSRRERTLAAFRAGELQCLIATNVAARGLDIPTVSHVLNYDIPEAPEEYVHRIGRTARNGARGVARTFITPDDGQFLVEIEKHIGLLLEEEHIDGFQLAREDSEVKRSIADMPVGTPRLLKPLIGGIRLGRRR